VEKNKKFEKAKNCFHEIRAKKVRSKMK